MRNFRTYLFVTLVVTFLSELYFYPFSSSLRFAVGVAALSFFIITMSELSITTLTIYCGISALTFRTIYALFIRHTTLGVALSSNYPALIYYIIYGMLAHLLNVRKEKNNFIRTILILTIIDALSNIIEGAIRDNLSPQIIKAIILIGFVRSFSAYFIFWFYNKQALYIQTKEHQKRYSQLNKLISDIQAEMFYLKKSMKDIETVMTKSYNLYDEYKYDIHLRDITLDISREVHEIKKDYHRVISGFESVLKDFEKDDSMRLSDMFTIIEDNTRRYIRENKLSIEIIIYNEADFYLKTYYSLFSILNNLIINSIQACDTGDRINVYQYSNDADIIFKIADTGEGIDEDILPYIFNPGFTTKFDETTGKPSTGIGLSHIKNIVEELSGTIEFTSELDIGTTAIIIIPKLSIIGDDSDE